MINESLYEHRLDDDDDDTVDIYYLLKMSLKKSAI